MRTKSDWGKAFRRAGKETNKAFFTGKTVDQLVKKTQVSRRKEVAKWQNEQIQSLKRQSQLKLLKAKEESRRHPFRNASPYLRKHF